MRKMKVKKLVKKIEKLSIQSCTSCPFHKRNGCKLHSSLCVCEGRNISVAESILQLEKFFKAGEIRNERGEKVEER